MKFGQVREHNKIFFIKNHVEYKAERLVPDNNNALYEAKSNALQLIFNIL